MIDDVEWVRLVVIQTTGEVIDRGEPMHSAIAKIKRAFEKLGVSLED